MKYINTLDAHYYIDRKEHAFCFDNDIVEKIIGGMFFDLDSEDEYSSKEHAMSIFKKMDTSDDTNTASVKNMKQFRLVIKYISLGSSFRLASRIFQVTKEELHFGQIGSVSEKKVIDYVRIVVATPLQYIKDLLEKSWCYSVAFDGATYIHTSYLDIRVRVFNGDDIQNIHVIALPMVDRHTGEHMHELFEKLFNILDPRWKTKLVGITTDGAVNMTGRHKGAVTKIQNSALGEGFYRLWCVLHQMDIVVQKCVTSYFSDDFYSALTGFIGYLRRKQNLIQEMASKCPKVAVTRWLRLGKVCQWFCKNRTKVLEYVNEKKPSCKPAAHWWLYVAACDTIMKEVNITFVAGQSLKTLVGEQLKKPQQTEEELASDYWWS